MTLQTWCCSHSSRLSQFKKRKGHLASAKQSACIVTVNQAALQCNSICVCASKTKPTDKLIECRSPDCKNGNFFILPVWVSKECQIIQTFWQCHVCKKGKQPVQATTSTSYVSMPAPSTPDSVSDNNDVMRTSQLTYTAEVNWKMFTQVGFELAPSGYWSAALPVQLSTPQGLEASFLTFFFQLTSAVWVNCEVLIS